MRVEIITLHRVTNFGSMLQTYATQKSIEKLGYEAEVIDFVPEGLSFKRACFPRNDTPIIKKLLKFLPLMVVNSCQFLSLNAFLRRYINLSEHRYNSFSDLEKMPPEADVYLSGSDQVWNTQNNNPVGDYRAYFLGFAPEEKPRIAYAGSFGKSSFSDEEASIIREYLSRYGFVSVREDEGLEILERFGFCSGVHVVDPTLLLTGEEWRQFVSKKKIPKPGYVFVYNLNRNAMLKKVAKAVADEKGLRIVNFADSLDFMSGASNRVCNTALDFINYVAHADYVVTDSFHGTAFSLNFNRQVIVAKAPRYNTRIESLLRLFGLLETRQISSVDEGLKAARTIIDYGKVGVWLDDARKKSFYYLDSAFRHLSL